MGVVKPMPFDFSNKSKLPETALPKAKRGPKSFLATSQPHDKRHATDWLKRRSLLSRVLEQAKSQLVICNNYHFASEMVQVGILPSTDKVWRLDPCTCCPARAGWGEEAEQQLGLMHLPSVSSTRQLLTPTRVVWSRKLQKHLSSKNYLVPKKDNPVQPQTQSKRSLSFFPVVVIEV